MGFVMCVIVIFAYECGLALLHPVQKHSIQRIRVFDAFSHSVHARQ